jgi:hypothetical protein
MVVATMVVALVGAGDLAGDLLLQLCAGIASVCGAGGQQGSQENEGHWAFHLDLLRTVIDPRRQYRILHLSRS